MASAREIRRRIRSIRNTAQITKALEMVSAAKMRRATAATMASRPYAEQLAALIETLGATATSADAPHPLLQRRPVKKAALVLITPDRGLCGALIGNIIRAGGQYISEHQDASIVAVGRRGRDWMLRRGRNVIAEFTPVPDRPTIMDVAPMARIITDDFIEGSVDEVTLVYTKYYSATNQRAVRIQLLPVQPPVASEATLARYANFTFEPSPEEVLSSILPRYIEVQLYQALLESRASEESARMIAMHNATENARDIVNALTLSYNKARQAGITSEILEISSGAEALRSAT